MSQTTIDQSPVAEIKYQVPEVIAAALTDFQHQLLDLFPGDPRWQQIVDLAMDVMFAHGPYISVLVVGENLFNSNWSVAEAAQRKGKVLWQKPLT
jgi:formate/nitrite transporter FocA (FNT family)